MPILPKPTRKLADAKDIKERDQIQAEHDAYLTSIMSAEPRELSAENQRDLGAAIVAALPQINERRL